MRSVTSLAWWGLVVQLSAMACFAIVFAQLYGIEHPVFDGFGSVFFNFTEARFVQRWAMAGIALCIVGTTLLLVATRRPSQANT